MSDLKPCARQLEFLDWEFGLFFHFGIRTFHEGRADWDEVYMDPAAFDPALLDCRQWADTAKKAGARYCILTAKHHDGFALWQTETTPYGVRAAKWKGGKGDVVKEFTDACREMGLKTGLYYSPAEFGSVKRAPEEYDEYFIAQITELLTRYGKIDYLWFDGCGAGGHRFDSGRIVDTIRKLQPEILLFNLWDPDVGWIGNEQGVAPEDRRYETLLPAENAVRGENPRFLPYECDCKLRPNNWFWSRNDADTLRSVDEIEGLYDLSVGRGCNLLLNVGPDDRGLLPERDAATLAAFGERLRERFAAPLPVKTETREDGALLTLAGTTLANTLVLEEDLTAGEKINAFSVLLRLGEKEFLLEQGHAVGHKRIVRFPTLPLGDGSGLFIRLTDADPGARLKDIRLYFDRRDHDA